MNDTIRVGNTEIGPSTDFVALLRRQLTGGTPLSGRYDESPEQGAISLFSAVRDTALVPRVADAIVQLLTDANLDVRAGAAAVVEDFPNYFDNALLLRILQAHSDLFDGVGSNHFGRSQPDLAWALLRAMAATPARNSEVRDRLRLAVQDPVNGNWVLAGVTANDSDWVVHHPAEVVQVNADRAWIILLNLGDANRERFVRMLPSESPELRNAINIGVERAVQNEQERKRLVTLLTS